MNDVKNIAKDLVKEMPIPQDHAIETEQAKEAEAIEKIQNVKDDKGIAFDPALHETDNDGNPLTNKNGGFKKKRGRKAGKDYSTIGSTQKANVKNVANPGAAIAESIFAIGQMIGGEEWQPQYNVELGVDERGQMVDAWTAYCEQSGIEDFPPGIAVTMAMLSYTAPRFFMPKTKSRFAKAKNWVLGKWFNWRSKEKPKEEKEAKAENE